MLYNRIEYPHLVSYSTDLSIHQVIQIFFFSVWGGLLRRAGNKKKRKKKPEGDAKTNDMTNFFGSFVKGIMRAKTS